LELIKRDKLFAASNPAATTMLRSHTPATGRAAGFPDAMSLQQLHSAPGVNKLPTEDFEDHSLVFSRTKQ
jgi:hypothetical protein